MPSQDNKLTRRKFLTSTAIVGATAVLAGCDNANSNQTNQNNSGPTNSNQPTQAQTAAKVTFDWKMVTTWPAGFPILQTGTEQLAQRLKEMSGGALNIEVFAGGELVPALESFNAVSGGTAQASSSSAYYWGGIVPAAQFFTSVPFGFTYSQMMSWMHGGGALELWHEVYEPFGMIAFPWMTTGVQMGGWFNKSIDNLDDLQGLKMRMPGLGGAVLGKAGVSTINVPGAEIFTSMQTGTIDACEWVGPYHDTLLGFPQVAQYYYHPGWHEPGPVTELAMGLDAWNKLPKELQQMIQATVAESSLSSFAQFETENAKYLAELSTDYPNVEIRRFPDEVLAELKRITTVVMDEQSEANAEFARVRAAYDSYAASLAPWSEISLESYIATEHI